ncbi:ATP synthase subunit epsilon mitochondrial [Bienertia sinuspersici]
MNFLSLTNIPVCCNYLKTEEVIKIEKIRTKLPLTKPNLGHSNRNPKVHFEKVLNSYLKRKITKPVIINNLEISRYFVENFHFQREKARKEKKREKSKMSSSAAAPFWRAAGMTYISYSNICANLVRNCLKEPFKSEVLAREKVHYAISKFEDGKPRNQLSELMLLWTKEVYFAVF